MRIVVNPLDLLHKLEFHFLSLLILPSHFRVSLELNRWYLAGAYYDLWVSVINLREPRTSPIWVPPRYLPGAATNVRDAIFT